MSYLDIETETKERNILRKFFKEVSVIEPIDNTVSDAKIIRQTQSKLKMTFRGSPQRCTCAKRTWGGTCEVCQGSDGELYWLRFFFREIRKAKKQGMSPGELKKLIEDTCEELRKNLAK